MKNERGKGCLRAVLFCALALGALVVIPATFIFVAKIVRSSVLMLIPLILGCLFLAGAVYFSVRFIQFLFGGNGEVRKYHERREEESEAMRRRRQSLEKMARRIESLETILTEEESRSMRKQEEG